MLNMVEYMDIHPRFVDGTDTGSSSYIVHVIHAAQAIAAGRCNAALITPGGRSRTERGPASRQQAPNVPDVPFELP